MHRAIQIAESDPKGPVYLTGAREVLSDDANEAPLPLQKWRPIAPSALPPNGVAEIIDALMHAENPLIVTSFTGRNTACVAELVRLCERLAIPVAEERPIHVNFLADYPLHLGYLAAPHIAAADVILVLDCDVPWLPSSKDVPPENAKVFYIDVDPLKDTIPLWYMASDRFYKVDARVALTQLNDYLDTAVAIDSD